MIFYIMSLVRIKIKILYIVQIMFYILIRLFTYVRSAHIRLTISGVNSASRLINS